MPGYIFILVLLVLMWFLLIRPQRRRQVETQRMIQQLEVGKEIVTGGAIDRDRAVEVEQHTNGDRSRSLGSARWRLCAERVDAPCPGATVCD